MILCGVKPGDKVFCQSLTFSASANPVVYCGGQPVFIDSERETWNMDPDALRKAFEIYGKPKAVIAVHLYEMCIRDRSYAASDTSTVSGLVSNVSPKTFLYTGECLPSIKTSELSAVPMLSYDVISLNEHDAMYTVFSRCV